MFWRTSPDDAAKKVVAALSHHPAEFTAARRGLIKAAQAAKPGELEPALVRLAPALATAPLRYACDLAQTVGAMAGQAGNAEPVLGVLVERACEALEAAHRFQQLYPVDLPDPAQQTAWPQAARRLAEAYPDGPDDPETLAVAWFAAGDCTQPVLFLCQRAEVRAALPQRDRLLAAVESMRDICEEARWLRGLLAVVDGAALTVLHRPTGRGFRMTISGVGHNYQLHTLLAARLIGDGEAGWLPGTPPTPAMVAAADGTGDQLPAGGIANQFAIAGPDGEWIDEDGWPRDLPMLADRRTIILEAPDYERGWTAGRAYPLMTAAATVDGRLTDEETAALLAMTQPPGPQQEPPAPPGWTDDLRIALPPGQTIAQLVDTVLDAVRRGADPDETEQLLVAEYRLSPDDAVVAVDRALGGLVRAGTRNAANCPDPAKDPIAWETFQRGMRDRSLVKLVRL